MNIVLVISDTLRRDFLGCYGNSWISTPNIDKFAKNSIVFNDAYIGSFPTVPHRHEILTGKFPFTYHTWAPLPDYDFTLPKLLKEKGYISVGIFDTPHPFAPGMNYQRDFDAWILIRGQENDRYITEPLNINFPCKPEKLRNPYSTVVQYLKNVSKRIYEEDYFCAKTFIEASRWIEKNYKLEKFFLYIDTFDPHEPWDPPEYFVEMYAPEYKGEKVFYPRYGSADILTEEELKYCRFLYAGEVSLVDRWFGYFLRKLEDIGLIKNTCIIFTSDHGFYLGEHNLIGKSIIMENNYSWAPLYEEIVRIPLIVYFPGTSHRLINGLVQVPDITRTILEIANVEIPSYIKGKSLFDLIKKGEKLREFVVSSPPIIHGSPAGEKVTITDSNGWCYIFETKKGEEYNIKAVDSIERKTIKERETEELYFLPDDPKQEKNLIDSNFEIAKRLKEKFIRFLYEVETEEKIINLWK